MTKVIWNKMKLIIKILWGMKKKKPNSTVDQSKTLMIVKYTFFVNSSSQTHCVRCTLSACSMDVVSR